MNPARTTNAVVHVVPRFREYESDSTSETIRIH